MERPVPGMPPNGELVRATGLCSVCDFKFRNEVVARYSEPAMPGGWAYVELRHLDAGEVRALVRPAAAAPESHLVCASSTIDCPWRLRRYGEPMGRLG